MFLARNEYDRGVNTFSPEGRLWQIEYTMEAIQLGSTAIGIRTSEGVLLAAERHTTSPLMEPWSIQKIVEIDTHIACAMSGLVPDARMLIDHARTDAQNYRFNYSAPIPGKSVTRSVCDLALRFGEDREDQSVMSRPFGVALLLGGVDANGPFLFHMDPAGNYTEYLAKAIGNGSDTAQGALERGYREEITLSEAYTLALTILRQIAEKSISSANIDMAFVPTGSAEMQVVLREELDRLISEIPPEDIVSV